MKILILFIAVFTTLFASSQSNINFNNKILNKELLKENITTDNLIKIEELNTIDYASDYQFYTINSRGSDIGYVLIGRVNSCRASGCSETSKISLNEESEYFDYIIFFDLEVNVKKVRVFNYQASHGQEIVAKGWLNQFIGHNAFNSLSNSKNIDAISGATISVNAITNDIELKTTILTDYVNI